jgi:hypothetical protein
METESGEKERSPPGATWTVTVIAAVAVVGRTIAARSKASELATHLLLFETALSVFRLFIIFLSCAIMDFLPAEVWLVRIVLTVTHVLREVSAGVTWKIRNSLND